MTTVFKVATALGSHNVITHYCPRYMELPCWFVYWLLLIECQLDERRGFLAVLALLLTQYL